MPCGRIWRRAAMSCSACPRRRSSTRPSAAAACREAPEAAASAPTGGASASTPSFADRFEIMTLKLSRRSGIAPFIVMQVMRAASERVASGDDVVHMEVGQPSSGAPRGAVEALKRAVDAGPLGYTDALGNPELRRRIARHYGDSYGVDVPWQRIAVTTG